MSGAAADSEDTSGTGKGTITKPSGTSGHCPMAEVESWAAEYVHSSGGLFVGVRLSKFGVWSSATLGLHFSRVVFLLSEHNKQPTLGRRSEDAQSCSASAEYGGTTDNSAMTCSGRRSQHINSRRRSHSLRGLRGGASVWDSHETPTSVWLGLMSVKQQETENVLGPGDKSRPDSDNVESWPWMLAARMRCEMAGMLSLSAAANARLGRKLNGHPMASVVRSRCFNKSLYT